MWREQNWTVAKGIIIKEVKIVNEVNFKKSIHYRRKEKRSFGGTQGQSMALIF